MYCVQKSAYTKRELRYRKHLSEKIISLYTYILLHLIIKLDLPILHFTTILSRIMQIAISSNLTVSCSNYMLLCSSKLTTKSYTSHL